MRLVRNPWIWLLRFRKRRGYGVHSPFAYSFVRGVVLEQTPYYAYQRLSELHPWWVRWGSFYPLSCRRLLFRLANFAHPGTIRLVGNRPTERVYLTESVPSARWVERGVADFVFVAAEHVAEAADIAATLPSHAMMVIEGIHRNKDARMVWHDIQSAPHTGITFDLYTYGVVFFDLSRHKQHYKVNF